MAKKTEAHRSKKRTVASSRGGEALARSGTRRVSPAGSRSIARPQLNERSSLDSGELDAELDGDASELSSEVPEVEEAALSDEVGADDISAGALVIRPEEPDYSGELQAPQIGAEQRDLLKRYMHEVAKYPLLEPEKELELAIRLRDTGDIDAASQLVRANLRLVVKIASEYFSAYQNLMDLIQEGNIGLMKAVSKFDPTKGAKLSYYASWWIRSYILKYILDNFRMVRVGTTQAQKKLFFHLMREKERLEAQGIEAGPKLLADRLQVREQDVVEMESRLSARGAEMSLDTPVTEGSGDSRRTSFVDLLKDRGDGAELELELNELKTILRAHLEEFVATLSEKERAVFERRLASDDPKTLQEVADQYGLTRERVRQIEVRVIEKMRAFYQPFIR